MTKEQNIKCQAIIYSASAAVFDKMLIWRLLKWLPFMGTFINNTCTAKITEFIGWEIANEFSKKLVFY